MRCGHAGVHLRSTEEGLSRAQVAGVAEAHVHQVPVSIDRPIEILPPNVNPHIGLVHVPTGSHRAVAPLPQGLAQQRGELALPVPHGFMGEDHATLQKHFGQVPQTQLIPMAPHHHKTDHIGRILQIVEPRAYSLIERPLAITTATAAVASYRVIGALIGLD
jgi:hypothetical protein